jgi:hypothetical protein
MVELPFLGLLCWSAELSGLKELCCVDFVCRRSCKTCAVCILFAGDPVRPVPKDEDAEFRLMQSNPLPSIEDLVNRSSYKQQPQPSASSGSYELPLLPDTETQQQKNPSYPLPSQFRIPAV